MACTSRSVPALPTPAPSARPRSALGSASSTSRSASTSARPFSSTNLSASVATSRFKSFAIQYEILCKNPILCALALEVPWKNLLDLFTLKFFGVGDVLWHHGVQPTELAFVLCGGFLVRHMKVEPIECTNSRDYHSSSTNSHQNGTPIERSESIVSEKLLKPGTSIAAFAVDQSTPISYSVTTAKFKSILISLPIGKYKSVLRQLTLPTKAALQQVIYENECKVCTSIKLPPPQQRDHSPGRSATAPMHSSPRRSQSRLSLKKSASTPAMLTHTADPTVNALHSAIHTASWDSLKVTQPVEYEVNSSLLILHEAGSSGKLHMPSSGNSASEQLRAKLLRGSSSSSAIRTIAKKHTTRRLHSIKVPAAVDAFPPPQKKDRDIQAEALTSASSSGSHGLDVVPKIRIGRLLAPIKKPAVIERDEDVQPFHQARPTMVSVKKMAKPLQYDSLAGRHVLLANRDKQFREEF